MNKQLIGILIFTLLANLFAEHPTGVRQLSEQERERILQDAVEYEPPLTRAELPSRVVNQEHLPRVWSQGQLGICGSFSPTYYVRNYYESKRLGEGRWDYEKDAGKMVSPTWSVIMVTHGMDGSSPDGASPLETIEKLCKFGYRPLAELPFTGLYQDWYAPTAAEQLSALRHKGGKPVVLSHLSCADKEEWLQKLKQGLAAGEIFCASTGRIPPNFDEYPGGGVDVQVTKDDGTTVTVNSNSNGIFVWPSTTDTHQLRGTHAVTIIGYDDNMAYTAKDGTLKKGALLAVNSWGANWGVSVNGEGGYIWFAYDAVLTHGFIEAEVYSTTVGDGDYTPAMTATLTFSCDGYPDEWKQLMMNKYGRFWPGGFEYKANGQELDNPLWPCNLYIHGIEADPTRAEALIDLSGFEDTLLWQFDISMGFGSNKNDVGKIVQADFRDAEGDLTRSVPLDVVVKPYSNSYPIFTCSLPNLYETEGVLPPLFPHTGSIQFGDLNGDGLLDAVSSVRQNNGVEGGIMSDEGYPIYVEERHSVWLRQTDGSWRENTLDVGDGTYELEVILVDLDGDNVLDIAASDGGRTLFLKNDGKGNFTRLAVIEHRDGEYKAQGVPGFFATADFDNDGRPDFVLVNSAQTQVIRQESPTKYTVYPVGATKINCTQPVSFARSIAVGDLNGDGWTDFVLTYRDSLSSPNLVFINNGGMRFTPCALPVPEADYTSIAIADADQDGCDDILFCGGPRYDRVISGYRTALRILRGRPNDANGNFQLPRPLPISSDVSPRWGGNAAWADVDMDGRLEAVMSGANGLATSDSYGDSYMDRYPLHNGEQNSLKVLSWDGEKYADSHLSLPSTTGFFGQSLMTVVDFDADGKPDIVHGGVFSGRCQFVSKQGPSRKVTGMKYIHNEVNATNAAPSAPTGLSAKDAKNGKAVFNWQDGTDAETAPGGLRYFLRVGTISGKDDVIAADNKFARKSGVTLTNLPAKKLYWAVRTVDATGNLSPWSAESTVTPSGTTPTPSVLLLEDLPETVALPEIDFDTVHTSCTNADKSQGSAYGDFGGYYNVGELIGLNATAKPGYRFAYWEGDVLEPLSRVSKAYYYNDNEQFVAHFMPDTSFLQVSAEATGYRDSKGNLWLLGSYNNVNGKVVQDTPPLFAAASDTLYFTLANGTAYYGMDGTIFASNYYEDGALSNHWTESWNRNRRLRVVDGKDWNGKNAPDDDEQVERAWGGPGGFAVINVYQKKRNFMVKGEGGSNKTNFTLQQGEDIIQCVVQNGFVLLLMSSGVVKGIGGNTCCQLGARSPETFSEYAEIKGLPIVTTIAAGAGFVAAIDTEGNVWTWGDNSHGQLGRGTVGAAYPTPAKIEGLTAKIIAIAAGDNHLVALDENGSLHAWGDNAKGQLGSTDGLPLADKKVTAVAAAADRTVAITDNGDLFAWGDGITTPHILDNVHFTPVPFTLDIDNRYAHLLPMGSGSYAARSGQPISLNANSDDENVFQYWLVNGETVTDNPLVITPTDSFTVKAFFASRPAVITLSEPEIGDTEITIPVLMSDSKTTFNAMDFTLQSSNGLIFSRLKFGWPEPTYTPQFDMASDSDDMTALRFLLYGGDYSETLFNKDKKDKDVELFKLVFIKPTTTMDATVKLTASLRLSRDYGDYSEAAVLGAIASRVFHVEGMTIVPGSPESYKDLMLSNLQTDGWNAFCLPGDSDIHTVAELEAALGVQDLVAWTWDGTRFKQPDELSPFQPLLLSFTGQPVRSLPYIAGDIPAINLKPGWNMVVVPQTTAPPDDASIVFRLDKAAGAYVFHEGALLPNELHWIFKKDK